jgi:oligopeptide/dipeptide ABC transporter ATP-binding protein
VAMLTLSDVDVTFPTPRGRLHAVNGVDLRVEAGETVGIIGESGCGKSTLAKAIMRIVPLTRGQIVLDGEDITAMGPAELRPIRAKLQMVFQDTMGALNPRRAIGDSIGQPLSLAGWRRRDIAARVTELLDQVGLAHDSADRYPNELSGGQRQRVGIARALALRPRLVICDEPVSALDVSVRAQVINLLADLRERLSIAYLFISHDLAVVEHIADRIVVMYLGRIVESGPRETFWRQPLHPYTRALLGAVPAASPREARQKNREIIAGEQPSPLNPPPGCSFHTRCPVAQERCKGGLPILKPAPSGNLVACHLVPDASSDARQ